MTIYSKAIRQSSPKRRLPAVLLNLVFLRTIYVESTLTLINNEAGG